MARLLTALFVLLLARPDALLGQAGVSTASILPGARVRITQPGQKPRVGVVVTPSADTLFVRWLEFANALPVPLVDISRLEVSNGRHRRLARGAAVGTLSGGTLGALFGAASYSPCETTEMLGCFLAPESRAQSAAVGGVLGGVLGLVVGTLAGLPRRDDWRQVPLGTPRVAAAVTPRGGATGLGLSLRF